MKCGACGVELRANARFCDMCGTKVDRRCPSCGGVIRDVARFCDLCGKALTDAPAPAMPTRQAGIAAGRLHTVAWKPDGCVLACGDDQFGQCRVEDWRDIVGCAAGKFHTVGVRADGRAVAIDRKSVV